MDALSDYPVDVSVLVPAYNCRAFLDRCLTSLLVQRVSKEIIVVDDGSTDESLALLELYARHHPAIRVISQEHTGAPGSARNRALSRARGRYVFFCDADDYLGPFALEKMLAMADRNGSDIVLGKVVGHGRRAPASMFRANADRVTLQGSTVYNNLNVFKLYRKSMLERHRIRFDESLRVGEDMDFAVHAYCHADVISVVADYDCYHLMDREDGTSVMQEPGSREPIAWLRMVRIPIGRMARHVPPGPLRDHLLLRHFTFDVLAQLGEPFLAADEGDREKIAVEVADLCDEWLTDGVRARLSAADNARLTSLTDPDRLVRLARVQSAPLRRRLTALEWAGDHLQISGSVTLTGFEGAVGLLLKERSQRAERKIPVTRVADLFSASIDVGELATGIWDVFVAVECEGIRRLGRLGADRDRRATRPVPRFTGGVVALPYLTRPYGNLSLDVGGHVVRVPASVRLTHTEWIERRLRIEGQVMVGGRPGAAAVRRLVWRERRTGRERHEEAVSTGSRAFAAETGPLGRGTWDAYLELDMGGPTARFPVKVGEPKSLERPRTWWQGTTRWTTRPYATAVSHRLSTSVRRASFFTLARRAFRRIRF
ncbi:glycosyl transferase [Acrocarpospora phusangensis]|uniref:Glycosyl transferase n=1 Tax=Acrocarpospora phusangensis TaxID=1070424 RepID=A0A919QFT3_9ACTN|nr:glycosyltransferase [Acrocarpospora phusangensis]GIH25452.1 glycosyl transferase [Acrocarpospora phusangensis]